MTGGLALIRRRHPERSVTVLGDAESKDPEDVDITHAVWTFSPHASEVHALPHVYRLKRSAAASVRKDPRGSFGYAQDRLFDYALRAPLRMTDFWGLTCVGLDGIFTDQILESTTMFYQRMNDSGH